MTLRCSTCSSSSGQGRPVGEGCTMTSLLLVMLARTRPQVQESRIHGDQGDPRQSTGQSTLGDTVQLSKTFLEERFWWF